MRNFILNKILRTGVSLLAVMAIDRKEKITYKHSNGKIYEIKFIKRHGLNK